MVLLSKQVMSTTQRIFTPTKKLSSLNGILKKLMPQMRAKLLRIQYFTGRLSTKLNSTTVWLFNSMASTPKLTTNP
jgi:hypothetical protein